MNKGVLASISGFVIVLAVILAGCGGGDEATASLTRSEFITQANAICKKATFERGRLFQLAQNNIKPGEELNKKGKENLVLTVFIPPYRKSLNNLEKLPVPEGDEQKVENILDAMEEAAKDVEGEPLKALNTIEQFYKANSLNRKYGTTDCVV